MALCWLPFCGGRRCACPSSVAPVATRSLHLPGQAVLAPYWASCTVPRPGWLPLCGGRCSWST
eukprot:4213056-Alexandrium_andersonii.AAC.1